MIETLVIGYLYFMGAIATGCWAVADDPKTSRPEMMVAAVSWPIAVPVAVLLIMWVVWKERRR